MLVGAYALAQNNHVRGDVFYRFFPVRVQAALDLVLYFVFFFPGILALVWAGYRFAEMSWRFAERSMMTPWGTTDLSLQDGDSYCWIFYGAAGDCRSPPVYSGPQNRRLARTLCRRPGGTVDHDQ